jgi:hypothetical protein
LVQADIEDEHVAGEKDQGVNQAPQPACGGTDVTLLEIALNQLYYQRSALNQVAQEMSSRNSFGQAGSLTAKRVDLQP